MTAKQPEAILLLLYKRPEFAKKQLDMLLNICPDSQVFVSIDGPKNIKDQGVFKTKKVVSEYKTKFKKNLIIKSSSKNLGCRHGVESAIDWFFKHVDRGIILEDDCVPDPTFFKYCNQLLNKYQNDSRVGMISGTNPFVNSGLEYSYLFSNQSIVWGWATWKNRWQDYQEVAKNGKEIILDKNIKSSLFTKTTPKHLGIFKKVIENKIDTWDYIWYITNIVYSRFCVIPNTNLISNTGFQKDATHTKIKTDQANLKIIPLTFPMTHPIYYVTNPHFESKYLKQVRKIEILFSILKSKLTLR